MVERSWPVPWEPVLGPQGGALRWLEAYLVHGAVGLAARLPSRVTEALGAALARVAPRLDRSHAAAARSFLRQALGELPPDELEQRVRHAYRHLFRVTLESTRLVRLAAMGEQLEHRFEVAWTDEVRALMLPPDGRRGGLVLVTAHVGQWEAGMAATDAMHAYPAYVVSRPPKNRPLSRLLQRGRERLGVRLIPRRGAMRSLPTILRAGGTVVMMLDQRARRKPVLAPFFGRPARCDRSAAVMLRRFGVPVVVCACYRTERPLHYRIDFFDAIRPEEIAGAAPEEVAARVNRGLERAILAAPDQYFWLHDRYKDTPASSAGSGIPPGAEVSSGQRS